MSDTKKKSAIKNLSENIGIKQRVFMGAIVAVSVVTVGMTFVGFSTMADESPIGSEAVAKSKLDIGANSSDVTRSKVGEELNYDPKSPMAEKVREARLKKIEEAKKKEGSGYMDTVVLEDSSSDADDPEVAKEEVFDPLDALINDTQITAYQELEKERNKKDVVTGIDDTINLDDRERARNERIADMTGQFENSRQNRLPGTQYVYVNRMGGELTDAFMNEQMGKMQAMQGGIQTKANGLGGGLGQYNNAGIASVVGKGDKNGGTGNSRGGQQQRDMRVSPDNPYYDTVFRDRTADVQPDFETSNNIQRMVQQQMGGAFPSANLGQSSGPGQIGGFDSRSAGLGGSGAGVPQVAAGSKGPRPYKTVGDVCYGQLNMPVNTDAPTPVKASILDYNCGKLRNSVLVAQQPARNGDWVSLTFNVMKYDGRAVSVNAIALDPESKSGVLADDVNRHYVSRYLSLAIAAGLPGWAESVRTTETRTDSDGEESEITERVSGTDQIAVITGAIAETITPAMQQNFSRPPTVKLYNGRPLLIMFMGDVVLN